MSVHDEFRREYTCRACNRKFREGDEYRHGTGICTPTIADMAIEAATKKPAPAPAPKRNLALENFVELGQAIQNAGGDAFLVLGTLKPLLEILASNKISIKAKYESTLLSNS